MFTYFKKNKNNNKYVVIFEFMTTEQKILKDKVK